MSPKHETLYVGRPNIGQRESFLARVEDILDRRWLSNGGPYVEEFEQKVGEFLGVNHCIAMCNATVGLEIATRAMGLQGEVIVPSYTFIATAHCLQWQEIKPIFCDIDPVTHNIDPKKVEALITPRTTGIMGVHLWGRGCDTAALQEIADRHGLKLVFDASHAFACSHQGRMIGGFGHAEVFSFHATKFINTLEGGVVTTNDAELANRMRMMRNFGFTGYDCVEYLGVNGKMNEISAAMGLTNLESMDEIVALNQRNFVAYQNGLADLPGVRLLQHVPGERQNYQYVVLEVDAGSSPERRDDLVANLHREGIIARKYFWPGCHRMEPYRTTQPDSSRHLPATEQVANQVVVLPTGQSVSLDDVSRVCSVIKQSFESKTRLAAA
jgi:dTDP-4-amino-4,6-dideoxygalactose transaminase